MRSRVNLLLAVTLILPSYQPLTAQNPAPQQRPDEPKIRIGTAEVTLDVVVRDKKGRPVKDLAASEFEIYEDGVRQQVESFRLALRESEAKADVNRAKDAAPAPATAPAASREKAANPGVIALVFDRLSPDARSLARKAGNAYAEDGLMANDFTGVFAIDMSLLTLQQYTDDPQLVKQAIEQATSRSTSTFASNNEQARNLAERGAALERQSATSQSAATTAGAARDSGGASASGEATGRAEVELALNQLQTRMLETFETLERNHQGYATANSLLALVNSMRNLPGRKSVIFFSEGLSLPPAVVEQFKSVINAANRANVSVYTVDSAGLRIDSPNL